MGGNACQFCYTKDSSNLNLKDMIKKDILNSKQKPKAIELNKLDSKYMQNINKIIKIQAHLRGYFARIKYKKKGSINKKSSSGSSYIIWVPLEKQVDYSNEL